MKKAFLQIVRLELFAMMRSRAIWVLAGLSVAWIFAVPSVIATDGTSDGAHHIFIRYGLGGVFTLLVLALSVAAASSLAKDRATRRLQLTLVRPVHAWLVAFGRACALTFAGACILTLAALMTLIHVSPTRACYRARAPQMESPRREAERMYDAYLADPETPVEVRRAKKSAVLRLLTQKAFDHYQTIETNTIAKWDFAEVPTHAQNFAIRLRFTNLFETRDTVQGVFAWQNFFANVSNTTHAVVMIPLAPQHGTNDTQSLSRELTFRNDGENSLMLRPRRDIHLLYRDAFSIFAMNLFFAIVELVCLLATIISLAMMLGGGLGRSVAIFTVLALLFLSVVSPAVVEFYPDQLETDSRDRVGLILSRAMSTATSPLASFHPIRSLAEDTMIESRDLALALAMDLIFLPFLFAIFSGVMISRKSPESNAFD